MCSIATSFPDEPFSIQVTPFAPVDRRRSTSEAPHYSTDRTAAEKENPSDSHSAAALRCLVAESMSWLLCSYLVATLQPHWKNSICANPRFHTCPAEKLSAIGLTTSYLRRSRL